MHYPSCLGIKLLVAKSELSDCFVASRKAKKKATNLIIKAKNVTVVLLHNKEEKVKGRKRSILVESRN